MRPFPLLASLRLLLVGLHLLYAMLQVALLFRFAGQTQRQRLTRCWSRQLLARLGIRIDADLGDRVRIEGGLLVANHISFIDIFVINALLPSAFVAKSDVAQWPLIGWLSRHVGTVFIQRGSRKAAHRTQQQMLDALRSGQRLTIFPEGTTTNGERVLPFHGALFQSAIDAAVPVHAIAFSYRSRDGAPTTAPAYIDDISLLDCLMTVLTADGLTARVTLAASFAPPLADRRHLAHRAHHAIAAALASATPPQHSDPIEQRAIPPTWAAQPVRNEAAMRQ